jgi:F0F1-type ATP synthase membrane subunit b/b'
VAAVSPSLTTFLFETANFVALAALLAWVFFKPVRHAIETQRLSIRTQEEEAARKLSDAEKIRQEIDAQHRRLITELEHMRAEAHNTAKQESDALLAATRAQLERERTTLQRDMLNLEKSQMTRLAGVLASAAHVIIKRFFEQLEGPELEQLLLKSACRELALLAAHALGPVTIESATSLGTEAQKTIALAMGAHQTTVDFRVVPKLVAGVRIATQQGLIDASVTGLARFAEQVLIDDMTAMIQEEFDHA